MEKDKKKYMNKMEILIEKLRRNQTILVLKIQ